MSYEQIIEMQKRFAKFNRVLSAILIIYSFQQYLVNLEYSKLAFVAFLVPFILVEFLLTRVESINVKHLLILRFVTIMTIIFSISYTTNRYQYSILILCLLVFCLEYFLLFDVTDSYSHSAFLLSIIIPTVLILLVNSFILSNLLQEFVSHCAVLLISYLMIAYVAKLFAQAVMWVDDKLFGQARLIENTNETNEALRLNQEKVKKANEQLGVQKIKLEAAYNKINNVNAEMMIQNDIIKHISSSLEIDKLMSLITESIFMQMGLAICAISLSKDATYTAKTSHKIQTFFGEEYIQNLSSYIEQGCFNNSLLTNKTYVDNHVNPSKYPFTEKATLGSIIIVPLKKEEQCVGVLFAGHRKYDYFIDNINFFEAIVSQFLIALNNANLYSKMQNMAIRDGLTGIFNRRHLTKLFNEATKHAIDSKQSLTVVLFDIDNFKQVNDTYGHLFGDVVIQTIASIGQEVADANQAFVGRYGGEEFVIIFENKGLEEAYAQVQKMKDQINSTPLLHNGETIFVKVSAGITSYPETCKNPNELLSRADWAMYYSKQNGKNQITIDNDQIREQVILH